MWKKGEDLVLRDKLAQAHYRVVMNLLGLILLGFCTYKLIGMYKEEALLLENKEKVILFVLGALFGARCLYFSFFTEKKAIIIGKEGIKVEAEGITYPWDKVCAAYFGDEEKELSIAEEIAEEVKRKLQGKKKRETPWYLHVLFDDGGGVVHKMHKLNSYDYNSHEIKEAVEYWSGRDIGDKEDWGREQYIEQLIVEKGMSKEEAEETNKRISAAIPLFKEVLSSALTTVLWTIGILTIVTIAIGKFISWKYGDFPLEGFPKIAFFIVFAFTPILLTLKISGMKLTQGIKELQQKEEVKALSQEEYEECQRITNLRDSSGDKIINILLGVWGLLILYIILSIYKII